MIVYHFSLLSVETISHYYATINLCFTKVILIGFFCSFFSIIETKVLCEWLIDGPFRMYNAMELNKEG